MVFYDWKLYALNIELLVPNKNLADLFVKMPRSNTSLVTSDTNSRYFNSSSLEQKQNNYLWWSNYTLTLYVLKFF